MRIYLANDFMTFLVLEISLKLFQFILEFLSISGRTEIVSLGIGLVSFNILVSLNTFG